MAWNLIRRVPVKGDRREHFEAETDPWEIAMRIAAVRKEREIDPAVEALGPAWPMPSAIPSCIRVADKRLKDMLAFVETLDRWYAQMLTVPKPKLAALIRLGTRDRRPAAARQAEVAREERPMRAPAVAFELPRRARKPSQGLGRNPSSAIFASAR